MSSKKDSKRIRAGVKGLKVVRRLALHKVARLRADVRYLQAAQRQAAKARSPSPHQQLVDAVGIVSSPATGARKQHYNHPPSQDQVCCTHCGHRTHCIVGVADPEMVWYIVRPAADFPVRS